MATLRLFVVRHGETANTRERRFTGWQDPPLSTRGQAQAESAAQALASSGVTAVYASPLDRARATADVIAKRHGLGVRVEPAFREMGFGAWEGLAVDEIAARDPEGFRRWREEPDRVVLDGGERLADVAARATAGLAELQRAEAGGVVVLVSHAVVIRLIVLAALGLGPDRLWSVDASPAGISELEFTPGWVTVHRMNTLAHLDGLANDRGGLAPQALA